MPVKNCCVITKSSGRSTWKRVPKWKAFIMGRDGPCGSCGKKVLNFQIFIIGYLQFVKREHLHAALCSTAYGASTVAGTAQAAAHTPKEWFCEAIQELAVNRQ
jgi:hypothetical protein